MLWFWAQAFQRPLGLFEGCLLPKLRLRPVLLLQCSCFWRDVTTSSWKSTGTLLWNNSRKLTGKRLSKLTPTRAAERRTHKLCKQPRRRGTKHAKVPKQRADARVPAQARGCWFAAPPDRPSSYQLIVCLPGCAPARPPKTKICAWGRDDGSTLSRDKVLSIFAKNRSHKTKANQTHKRRRASRKKLHAQTGKQTFPTTAAKPKQKQQHIRSQELPLPSKSLSKILFLKNDGVVCNRNSL